MLSIRFQAKVPKGQWLLQAHGQRRGGRRPAQHRSGDLRHLRPGWLDRGRRDECSSPIIASVYALAGAPGATTLPVKFPYKHTTSLFDVTSGNNGSCSPAYLCTGEVGYDGPTGWGTPNGVGAFTQ